MRPSRIFDSLYRLIVVAAVAAVGFSLFGWAKANMVSELYAKKLEDLAGEYESLRGRYNEAVEQAAVTEVVVHEGALSVVVRGSDRVLREIPTKLDPTREIHVDFVVRSNRLLIRRLYDSETAPSEGLYVDPELGSLDWTDPALARGISVYRGGLTDGRWVVTSSGNGALDLRPLDSGEELVLRDAPPVRAYPRLHEELERRRTQVQASEVLARLFE